MKQLCILLIVVSIVWSGCNDQDPIPPNKPEDNFNITIDGTMVAANAVTATLYNDYLQINAYGSYEFTMLIYLNSTFPVSMDKVNYSSLTMYSPDFKITDADGGTGSVLTFSIDETAHTAQGTFTAVLVNPDDPTDFVTISEANFDNVKYQIASDTAQLFGETAVRFDGELFAANSIYAYDTTTTTASCYSDVNGEYEMFIQNIPHTPGFYSIDEGNFDASSGLSVKVNVASGPVYSTVIAGGTLQVESYDAVTQSLEFNFTVSLQEGGGDIINLTEGSAKFYTGGIH